MRVLTVVIVCLLSLLGPAAAEDEKKEEPKKAAEEMTEAERTAALKRAEELSLQVLALYRQGKYSDAALPARKALALRERVLGPEHPQVAQSLNNLATVLHSLGFYRRARRTQERAVNG